MRLPYALAVACALAAWWFRADLTLLLSPSSAAAGTYRPEVLLSSLRSSLDKVVPGTFKVAVGYNTNLDLVVRGVPLLQQLAAAHGVDVASVQPADRERIASVEDLLSSFLHWFGSGGAAERFVASPALFDQLCDLALELAGQEGTLLGGNAGLIANNLAARGHTVLLGGLRTQAIQSLLHDNIQLAASEGEAEDAKGLYHLILEYSKGERFGAGSEVLAPRANRMIIVRDLANSRLVTLEPLHAALPAFEPEILIVSGLHLLEGEEEAVVQQRLEATVHALAAIPAGVAVHLELASMADLAFVRRVMQALVPHVDSIGLNEQELTAAVLAFGGTPGEGLTSHSHPHASAAVLEALHFLFAQFPPPQPPQPPQAGTAGAAPAPHFLTRIHFHCLAFHAVAQRPGGPRSRWTDPSLPAMAGSLTASTQACGRGTPLRVESADVDILATFRPLFQVSGSDFHFDGEAAVSTLHLGQESYAVSPVLVCKKPLRTVGLGDAISSAGMSYHMRPTLD